MFLLACSNAGPQAHLNARSVEKDAAAGKDAIKTTHAMAIASPRGRLRACPVDAINSRRRVKLLDA